jgi:hypothetical protein
MSIDSRMVAFVNGSDTSNNGNSPIKARNKRKNGLDISNLLITFTVWLFGLIFSLIPAWSTIFPETDTLFESFIKTFISDDAALLVGILMIMSIADTVVLTRQKAEETKAIEKNIIFWAKVLLGGFQIIIFVGSIFYSLQRALTPGYIILCVLTIVVSQIFRNFKIKKDYN